jgi:eukaryotic-like serine/threonine-protein kinase
MGLRFGRYETISPIASGGMATVYLGRALGAGGFERRVAIKVMHEHISDDLDFEAMFLDEARLAAQIHHPNVVSTIDVQKSEEGMFLVMEYVEGASLKRILRELRQRKEVMPIAIAVRVMVDALAGLHAAHELHDHDGKPLEIVHRDVSPHNILVGTDGITRLLDFGVARAAARLGSTGAGTLKGKIAYMPPEQGRGDEIDRRADVYAAGVVLWELLTGQRLFEAEHDGALVPMILAGPERSPAEANPRVPEAVDRVCMKALAVDPAQRFATAEDFADALEAALHASDARLPKPSRVATYVREFKVQVDPRASRPDSDDTPYPSAPSSLPEPSVPTDTSQLSVVGAVRSQVPPAATPRRGRVLLGIAAGAIATVVVLVWLFGGHSEAPAAATVPPAEQAHDEVKPAAPPAESPPPVEPPPPAVEPVSTGESASPSAASTAEKSTPPRKRRAPPPRTKNKSKNPVGFEPNTL